MDLIQILADFDCMGVNVPERLVHIVYTIITVLKFGIPILLIIFGMLDLGKAVMASKEDEIKKGQQMFIKRLIAAIIAFFVIVVVQLIINVSATDSTEGDSISNCVKGFTNDIECTPAGCTVKK